MVRSVINVKDHGAVGDGVADDTIKLQNAMGVIPSTGGTVGLPIGKYDDTGTLLCSITGSHVLGVGKRASMFYFNPTSNKPLLSFTAGASTLSLCSVRHLSMYGQGAFQKIGIQMSDGSDFLVEDVEIINWIGNGSIGLQTKGRDILTLRKFRCYADRPISIEENPNLAGTAADHFHFSDIYLVVESPTQDCITIAPDMQVNNLTLDGFQSWCKGRHGLYYNDAQAPGTTNLSLHIVNVRREQSDDPTGYTAYVNHPFKSVLVENVKCDVTARGFYFRKIDGLTIQNCYYNGTGEAFNADSTCGNIVFINFIRNPLSSMTMTGLTKTFDQPPIEIWQPS